VGRAEELSRIEAAIGRRGAAGLVVHGPAGMGKTRLVDEALSRVSRTRVRAHRVTASRAAATIPMGALSSLLPDAGRERARHADVLRHTARHLVAEARGKRVVVAVDDAHTLDDASAALVHHLATSSPVFVLATVRDGEPAPDALDALLKDRLVAPLPLGPLSTDEIGEALRHTLSGPVSTSVVHRLAVLSDGNPLLMTELLTTALAEDRLVQRAGLWCLDGPWIDSAALPTLVAARLSRLTAQVRTAAELVALGEPLGAAEVERLIDPDTLAAAEQEGLFTGIADERRSQLRMVHPLYAEAMRAGITPLRARAAYRALADALAATGARRRGDALRLAVWRLEGGLGSDPELLLRAAGEDGAIVDRRVAERLALAAEEAGGGLEARLVRAEAVRRQGRAAEADALLSGAAAEVTDDRERCQVAALRASNLHFGLNRPADAEQVLTLARAQVCGRSGVADAPNACDELDALQADIWFNAGRVGDAAALATDVLGRPGIGDAARAEAAVLASVALTFSGRPRQALEIATEGSDRGIDRMSGLLPVSRCLAHAYAGDLLVAEQLATAHYGQALAWHADELQGEWALVLGQLAVLRGRVVTAKRLLREAIALIQERAPTMGRYGVAYALCFFAEAAALSDELPAVDDAIARADALVPAGTQLCNRGRPPVWAAAARGELTTACRRALESADALASTQAHAHEAMACHDVVRLGAPERVVGRLERLAESLEGPLGGLYARHAVALAGPDADALDEVAGGFSRHGLQLLAAEAAAEASEAHRRAGRETHSLASAERSRELAAGCEGAHTPALALAHGALPITPREREVAGLAAHGLSNAEIAERLGVSERTVHNHLHRVYTKLGVGSRRQLRSVLP